MSRYIGHVNETLRAKGLCACVGRASRVPVEEAFTSGSERVYNVEVPVEPTVGVLVEMDRTPSVEASTGPCATLIIEMSFDDGKTWQHLHSADVESGATERKAERALTSGISVIGWGGAQTPTHTRARVVPHKGFRSTTRVHPIIVTSKPTGGR